MKNQNVTSPRTQSQDTIYYDWNKWHDNGAWITFYEDNIEKEENKEDKGIKALKIAKKLREDEYLDINNTSEFIMLLEKLIKIL